MKKLKTLIAAVSLMIASAFAIIPVATVGAAALDDVCGESGSSSAVCNSENKDASGDEFVATVVNTLLFVIGALSVVMIIVGGIFYVISQGDSGNITKAKNTILYSVIGLVVAILAYAIVNWVVDIF